MVIDLEKLSNEKYSLEFLSKIFAQTWIPNGKSVSDRQIYVPDNYLLSTENCWIWRGKSDSHNYGRMYFQRDAFYPHRVLYDVLTGDDAISRGFDVHHMCQRTICVCPFHMLAMTHSEHSSLTASGERNGNAKLNYSLVEQIRSDALAGIPKSEIARNYSISESHARDIINGVYWRTGF